MKFTVIPSPSPYNIILGRRGLKQLRAIPSTIHGMMKFPTLGGITTLASQTAIVFKCRRVRKKQAVESSKEAKPQEKISLTKEVLVNLAYPNQLVTVCKNLSPKGYAQLKKNKDIFAWELSDMKGVSRRIINHALNANTSITPVSQKRRIEDAEKAFQELKKVILNMSSLTTQLPKETICVYLAASKEVVIAVLLAKRKGKQCRVHYVSRTLHDAERNYAPLEKVDLALLHVSRRLRRYLEAHPIKVITDQPIKQILNKAEASRKLEKCFVELGAYDLTYEPHNVIKGQVLADFINEVPVCSDALVPWHAPYTKANVLRPLQANYVIREIHMGACNMHLKARSVVAKAIRQGYYWPTMHRDAREEIQAHRKVKFVIVAIDYFTKWIEAKPLAKITRKEINTAVAHPQANSLVERANRSLMEGIKTRLGRERKGWVDELPNVLWAHQTSLKTSNGETPYSLTFGSEAVIPAEISMPTHRTMMVKEGNGNEEEMRLNPDLLQERREAAAIREARYKMKMKHYYNKRVRPMSFKVGDYVYRRNEASRVENLGKLGPKWEGPYLVTEAYHNGSYKLQTMDDREVPRTCQLPPKFGKMVIIIPGGDIQIKGGEEVVLLVEIQVRLEFENIQKIRRENKRICSHLAFPEFDWISMKGRGK
ncbi:reverse transcriptase domain-containing protein [Tanacetum coccineum]